MTADAADAENIILFLFLFPALPSTTTSTS